MDITFSNVTRNSITVNNDLGSDVVILCRAKYAIPTYDVTGVTAYDTDFSVAPALQDAKVVYVGANSSVNITGLTKYTLYYFEAIDANDGTNRIQKSRWTLR